MMKFLLTGAIAVGLAGTAMLATATGASALAFSYSDNTAASIPDDNATGVSRDIVISDTAAVTDLTVTISGLQHTWAGDLIATITNVNTGTTVDLFNRIGRISLDGLASNFNGTYSFNSAFTNDILAVASGDSDFDIPSGNYVPSGSLAGFNGQSLAGTWRLTVQDLLEGDTGSFTGWTLSGQNNASAVPVPPQVLGTAVLAGLTAAKKARSRKAIAVA
jgi:Proprotein convertase P-domain